MTLDELERRLRALTSAEATGVTAAQLAAAVASLQPGPWVTPTFRAGWGSYGGSFGPVKLRRNGDAIEWQGLAKRTSGVSLVICDVPAGYAPTIRRPVIVQSGVASPWAAELVAYEDGSVSMDLGGTPTDWVSFEGIRYHL
jgi:hypothetical protein